MTPTRAAPIRSAAALLAFLLIAAMSFVASAFGTAGGERDAAGDPRSDE